MTFQWRTNFVKPAAVFLPLLLLAATSTLPGQSPSTPNSPAAVKSAATTPAKPAANPAKAAADAKAAQIAARKARKAEVQLKPFSAVAFGGGMSLMGVNLQAATNVNRYLNLRGSGNFFNYTANNISTNGFDLTGKVNMATAGVSLDYYPIPRMGFRVSPGMLFYNQNGISATASPAVGTSFSLNGQDFYSEAGTPLTVTANLGLNTHKQAFTLTTGWGNMIPRKRKDLLFGHLSFPFEIGAAFTGVPTLDMTLKGGICTQLPGQTALTCDLMTDTTPNSVGALAQSQLNTQLTTWRKDLNPLQVYPIFSFGVAYSIRAK
jgi:hypothetical protein